MPISEGTRRVRVCYTEIFVQADDELFNNGRGIPLYLMSRVVTAVVLGPPRRQARPSIALSAPVSRSHIYACLGGGFFTKLHVNIVFLFPVIVQKMMADIDACATLLALGC